MLVWGGNWWRKWRWLCLCAIGLLLWTRPLVALAITSRRIFTVTWSIVVITVANIRITTLASSVVVVAGVRTKWGFGCALCICALPIITASTAITAAHRPLGHDVGDWQSNDNTQKEELLEHHGELGPRIYREKQRRFISRSAEPNDFFVCNPLMYFGSMNNPNTPNS